jgi:diguanylate cyclase (GGDEF)-like protein
VASQWKILNELALKLQDRLPLELLLQSIVDTSAVLLSTDRTSVRLLDPTRSRLIAKTRAGAPMHLDPTSEFRLNEGLVGWIAAHVKPLRTGHAETDERYAKRADIKEKLVSFLGVPIVAGRTCVGVLSALHPSHDYFSEEHEEILTMLAGLCAPYVEMARLERLSMVDPLTGAFNRRALDGAYPADGPLSVMMVDVDLFKGINDAWGHAIGDEVLKRIVVILAASTRTGDAVIRWGGEEFLVLLPTTGAHQAVRVAERARAAVEQMRVPAGDVQVAVTISIGVAERGPNESRDELVERADHALYTAKGAGRNRVCVAERREVTRESAAPDKSHTASE